MRAKFLNELEFNFKEPPYKRYEAGRSRSMASHENPNKDGTGGGLSSEEQDIIDGHRSRIQELSDEIYSIEEEIDHLKDFQTNSFDDEELESYYSDVLSRYGEKVLDILNSGYSDEEKLGLVDKALPGPDRGIREANGIVAQHNYYHPEDTIEDNEEQIKKLETMKRERENTKDKLETKVYNIEKY